MTPRSRKPVIFGGMRGLATDNYHPNFIDFQMDEEVEQSFDCETTQERLNLSLQRSKSENSLLCRSPIESHTQLTIDAPTTITKSTSDETLSTPFRYGVSFLEIMTLCGFL